MLKPLQKNDLYKSRKPVVDLPSTTTVKTQKKFGDIFANSEFKCKVFSTLLNCQSKKNTPNNFFTKI